jgi:quercetin dioxygenase-like cupin family protein
MKMHDGRTNRVRLGSSPGRVFRLGSFGSRTGVDNMVRVFAAMFVLAVSACASKAGPKTAWVPGCSQVDCVEPDLAAHAPLGTVLSFSQCVGEGLSTYRYAREAAGWTLVGRDARADPSCGTGDVATPKTSKVTNLLQTSLGERFVADREVLVDLVEIPPNSRLDRHWHPGEEFHYYLDGEPEITIDGKGTSRPPPGSVGHVPFEARHSAGAGAAGARILVFRVHTTGEPWRYLEADDADGHDAERR